MWKDMNSAPKDGTRVLAIEGTDPAIVPVVVEWTEFEDGSFGWLLSDELLAEASDGGIVEPIFWTDIPRQDFGD